MAVWWPTSRFGVWMCVRRQWPGLSSGVPPYFNLGGHLCHKRILVNKMIKYMVASMTYCWLFVLLHRYTTIKISLIFTLISIDLWALNLEKIPKRFYQITLSSQIRYLVSTRVTGFFSFSFFVDDSSLFSQPKNINLEMVGKATSGSRTVRWMDVIFLVWTWPGREGYKKV